ncbi:MAG TPA: ComEC/Rec2 family competence protein, partial [Bryobacteraceae bacterium]|nr:ComEC/Rec2 family competence protein [Bryobacteraceae bacterium]
MRPARDLLVLPAAAFALGVVCHNHVAGTTALLTGIAGLLVTFVAALRINSRVGAHASAAGLALLCGALSFNYHRPRSIPRIDFAPGEVMLLSGCIVQPVDADASRAKFVLELAPKANARITVTARQGERLPHLSYGSQVEVEARIRVPRNFGNPGAFDYVGFLRRHEVYWTASARGAEKIRILPGRCGSVVGQVAANIRELVAERVAVLFSPDWKEARLLPALLIGTNGTSDRSSTEDFRRTGTYHALVVSGLHIAVVAGGLLFLMRACGLPLWVILPV